MKRSKNYNKCLSFYEKDTLYEPMEGIEIAQKMSDVFKFDQTVEISIKLGIDAKKSDQTVRGTVVLPHGTGKTPRVIVFAKGDKAKDAEASGADFVGAEDLIEKIKKGWMDFDIAAATPDMMGLVGSSLGRVLGPRMPNPKAGTVTFDIGKAVKDLKAGKVQYRNDKFGVIHTPIGKVSYTKEKIFQNLATLMDAIGRARPAAVKGQYIKTTVLSLTMGPGIRIEPQKTASLTVEK